MTHVPAASGDHIRPQSIQATCRLPKLDPWRSDQDRLPANGVHTPILHTAQRPRANPCTYDHRVGGSRLSGAERAVDDLLDVLNRRADELPTTGRKGLVQPEEVIGRVDGDRRELQPGLEDRRWKQLRWGYRELGKHIFHRVNFEETTGTPHTPHTLTPIPLLTPLPKNSHRASLRELTFLGAVPCTVQFEECA